MKDSPVPNFDVTLTHDDPDEIDLTLKVYREGRCVLQESDRGEPEDQSFYRDWSWVPDAIRDAYAYGVEDGHADVHSRLRYASAELHDAWMAIAPVLMAVVQSDEAGKKFLSAIKNLDDAVARSAPKEKK